LNDVCNDDNLITQLIMRRPSVGCHDMCFSFSSELIQEFYIHFFVLNFFLLFIELPQSNRHSWSCDYLAVMIKFLIPAR
jgi:hypothetical protein